MREFIIECDEKNILSVETAAAIEAINRHNWLYPENEVSFTLTPLLALHSIPPLAVPIGSVDFVETALRLLGGSHISPISLAEYVPEKYLRRRLSIVSDVSAVRETAKQWGASRVFLKSASRLKCDFSDIYSVTAPMPQTDDRLLVSEVLNIRSEWRAFVFGSRLVDLRFYAGDFWSLPDKESAREIIEGIGRGLAAYTLDLALTEDGHTVVIEIHPFIACGLYGAEVPIEMYSAAWYWELRRQGTRNSRNSLRAIRRGPPPGADNGRIERKTE